MKTTFDFAVILAAGELRATGNKFSIHDVTKLLRQKVNSGQLQLTDRALETVDSVPATYRIVHGDVGVVFRNALEVGLLNGLVKTFNPAGYTEYQNQTAPAPQPKLSPAVTAQIRQNVAAVNAAVTNLAGSPYTIADLQGYLQSKSGQTITMKQIQSRFDRITGVTCQQYADLVEAVGRKVNRTGSFASRWTVVA